MCAVLYTVHAYDIMKKQFSPQQTFAKYFVHNICHGLHNLLAATSFCVHTHIYSDGVENS